MTPLKPDIDNRELLEAMISFFFQAGAAKRRGRVTVEKLRTIFDEQVAQRLPLDRSTGEELLRYWEAHPDYLSSSLQDGADAAHYMLTCNVPARDIAIYVRNTVADGLGIKVERQQSDALDKLKHEDSLFAFVRKYDPNASDA